MSPAAENTIISLLTEIRDMLRDGQPAPARAAAAQAAPLKKKTKAQECKEYARNMLLQTYPGIASYLPPIAQS